MRALGCNAPLIVFFLILVIYILFACLYCSFLCLLCVVVHFFRLVNACFCCVRFILFFFHTNPRDWLREMFPKWPILCRVGRKTTTQSINQSVLSHCLPANRKGLWPVAWLSPPVMAKATWIGHILKVTHQGAAPGGDKVCCLLLACWCWCCGWRRGVVVSGVRRMNEVNPCRAQLVLGWVTVFGRVYHLGM